MAVDAEEALAVVAEATAAAVAVLAVEVLQAHGNTIRNTPTYYAAQNCGICRAKFKTLG